MKGISTILATILIVIIVVALVSLTYTFAIGLFGTAARGAEAGVTATTIRLDKAVAFVTDPACTYSAPIWTVTFTIRHTGATYNISYNEIAAYFGTDGTTTDFTIGSMAAGTTKTIRATNTTGAAWGGATRSFVVSAPAGEVSKSVTCP